VLDLTSAPKSDEPVDEFAATVVLDERTPTGGNVPNASGETLGGNYVQDIEAALRRDVRR
jgi:hypothetical protein